MTLEIYIELQDSAQKAIGSLPAGELSVRIQDPLGEELFSDEIKIRSTDLKKWSTRLSGENHAGIITRVPIREITRSLTGRIGTVHLRLEFTGRSVYFEYDFETNDLPEATDAEKTASSLDRFLESAINLSGTPHSESRWKVTPLQAGCFTSYGSYGSATDGVRIDFEIVNLSDSIRSWYDDLLLRTPDGFTVEPRYDSPLRGLDTIPDLPEKGFVFFDDLECTSGEYRIVASSYSGVYLDESFSLGLPTSTASASTTTAPASPTSSPTSETTTTSTSPPTTTTSPPTTTQEPATTTTTTEPVDLTGTREQPVLMGDGYDLGDGWTLAVTGVNRDAAAAIAAANMFNDPPEPGRRFVLVDLDISYAGTADPETIAFEVSIDAVGSSGLGYDSTGCGVKPDGIDLFRDIFAGGIESGQVCFDVSEGDADSLVLYASAKGGNLFFSLDEWSAAPTGVYSYRGPLPGADSTDSRLSPTPLGETVDIGGGWSLRVNGMISDQTPAVLNENMFNDAPPTGYIFAIVNVTLTNVGDQMDTAFWVSTAVVGESNVEFNKSGCGVIPSPLDTFADVFPGGSVTGNVCFALPSGELEGGLVLYSDGVAFGGESQWFAVS